MPDIAVVLGDQLFDGLPGLPGGACVFMKEDWGLCTRTRHHKQKIALFLAAMRAFRARLVGQGRSVDYLPLNRNGRPYSESLASAAKAAGAEVIYAYEPADQFIEEDLRQAAQSAGAVLRTHPNPSFLTSKEDWSRFRTGRKRLVMGDFYKQQRLRLGLLMDGASPVGGKWSFDEENRRPIPRGQAAPAWPILQMSPEAESAIGDVERWFPDNPGTTEWFSWPVSHDQARDELNDFISQRLSGFGKYEDAMTEPGERLWHSGLSPALNMGLLLPMDCCLAAEAAWKEGRAPLNSVEGFVRQIIGWREFVRQVDREYPRPLPNALGHSRRLGPQWQKGTTGLAPLDDVIKAVNRRGWCHHIERLMVAGSAMLMCEVDPANAYRWFMEMFVDSADWVMAPNVIGMSQFADGGLMATKPYVSGSSYLLRMGQWQKGPWCDVWDGLFWRFISRHASLIAGNPRLKVLAAGLDRLDSSRRTRILALAEDFVEACTLPPQSTVSP